MYELRTVKDPKDRVWYCVYGHESTKCVYASRIQEHARDFIKRKESTNALR